VKKEEYIPKYLLWI